MNGTFTLENDGQKPGTFDVNRPSAPEKAQGQDGSTKELTGSSEVTVLKLSELAAPIKSKIGAGSGAQAS